MSDIKLFHLNKNGVSELEGKSVALEKSLQFLIEKNLETILGVTFLASEYNTGKKHGGRIDTLGIDENHCPVIIEYKRSINENVINQGLFYLDWLLDHKAEFKLMVMKSQREKVADAIEWSTPRLVCVAGDFTKYDEHAVQQIDRNIELIRYRRFGNDFLIFELVNATTAQGAEHEKVPGKYKTVSENLNQLDNELCDVFNALKSYLMALGDDVQMKTLKYYEVVRLSRPNLSLF